MDKIKQTADCLYRTIRVNKNNFKVYSVDEWATLILALFVFGTMYVSIANIGI